MFDRVHLGALRPTSLSHYTCQTNNRQIVA
jgi:hypothetical protein